MNVYTWESVLCLHRPLFLQMENTILADVTVSAVGQNDLLHASLVSSTLWCLTDSLLLLGLLQQGSPILKETGCLHHWWALNNNTCVALSPQAPPHPTGIVNIYHVHNRGKIKKKKLWILFLGFLPQTTWQIWSVHHLQLQPLLNPDTSLDGSVNKWFTNIQM